MDRRALALSRPADWHLESAYDWNDTHNQPVTKRPLPEVVNPAFGPAASPSGYPLTHYVGVAGVGDDAAQLPADDPRAGVFGYGRQTRSQDLARGGANTIAVLGVQDQCGPWAQGGRATVRPLTRQPYVNGPDGFGSGQADGMVVGMADGSVRFLSKDIDPRRDGATGDGPRRRAGRHGRARTETAGSELKPPVPADPKPPAVAGRNPPRASDVKPPSRSDPVLQAKLNVPIAKISLPNMPLADAVQLVSAMSTLPVSFDPDAMEELGVSLHDPISIEVADSTVGKTLEAIAAKRNMTSLVENGQIVLTSTADHRESLRPARYAVSDLTGGDAQAAADLAALLQRLVVPESWQAGGGRGTVEVVARPPPRHANRTRPLPNHRLLRETPRRPRSAHEESLGSQELHPCHTDRPGEKHLGPDGQHPRECLGIAGKHSRSVQAAGGNRDSHRPPRVGRNRRFRRRPRQVQGRQVAAGRRLAAVAGTVGAGLAGRRCQHPASHHPENGCRGWNWSFTPLPGCSPVSRRRP